MQAFIIAFCLSALALNFGKVLTMQQISIPIAKLLSLNRLLLACAVVFLLGERLYFYASSISAGFFFDYFIYLGALYGNWALLHLILSFCLLSLPLIYLFRKTRKWKIFNVIILAIALFYALFNLLFLEKELLSYRSAWTFAFGGKFLPLYTWPRRLAIVFLWSIALWSLGKMERQSGNPKTH